MPHPLPNSRYRGNYPLVSGQIGNWAPWSATVKEDPTIGDFGNSPQTQIDDFHDIHDFINAPSRFDGRWPVAECSHLRIIIPPRGPVRDYYDTSLNRSVVFDSPKPMMPVVTGKFIDLLDPGGAVWQGYSLTVPDDIREELSLEAFNYFADVFPTELSFSESVQGLTQLRDLIPEIGDSIRKTLAGGYLNKEFGWDNLLSDLNTLGNLFESNKARLEYLKKTYGIPTRLGFARRNIYQLAHPKSYYSWYETYSSHGFLGSRMELISYHADFRATAWITQALDYLDGFIGFLRVLTGQLGLNNPVKRFWEVIPFSFVIDWFAHVDRRLDHLTRLNPPVGWNVSHFCHSTKVVAEWKMTQSYKTTPFPDKEVQSIVIRSELYDRYVGLSYDWELLDPNLLSEHQLVLLGALALAQG